ncbi:MAG: urate oxidase [Candidatus Acidiferrum sp.]
MAIRLGENNYGKQRVRLLRVTRRESRHDIKELTLGIRFEGDFETAHSKGDNRNILPTDTMKNTVYALARQHPIETTENFCLHLAKHFLERNPQVTRVHIEAIETLWVRLPFGGKSHAYTFTRSSEEKRTAEVTGTREEKKVSAGIEGLAVLKTTQSAFEGFLRDEYTTLKEDRNRILSTLIRANWVYRGEETEFGTVWHAIRQTMLETFAEHDSQSLQQTLYAMGEAVLSNFDSVREIHLSQPNKHYNLVDLSPFRLDNPGVIFLPTDEPHGLIEATLRKD